MWMKLLEYCHILEVLKLAFKNISTDTIKKARISWGSVDSFQWFEFNPCMYQFKLTANCNNDFSHCHTWSNPTLYGTHKSLFFLQNHYLWLRRKTRVIRNQPHKKSWYVFIYRNDSIEFDSHQLLSYISYLTC